MTTVITGNRVRRSTSSSESRRQEVTEQTWYAAEDCSRSVQRRLAGISYKELKMLAQDRSRWSRWRWKPAILTEYCMERDIGPIDNKNLLHPHNNTKCLDTSSSSHAVQCYTNFSQNCTIIMQSQHILHFTTFITEISSVQYKNDTVYYIDNKYIWIFALQYFDRLTGVCFMPAA